MQPLPQDENGEVKLPDNLPDDVSMKIRNGGEIRRIVVDRQGCIAARSCVLIAPGVFQMDEENIAYVVDPESETDDMIRMAAESCPTLAIHLYDKDGKKLFPES